MALESSNTIDGLDESWPTPGDDIDQGQAHIRLVKHVLKSVFPGAAGHGFAKTILATEDQINLLKDLTELPNPIAKDTVMLFVAAAAPTKWVQVKTDQFTNRALHVVADATGGAIGGTDDPLKMDKVPSHTHGFTTGNNNRSHTHSDSGHAHGFSAFVRNAVIPNGVGNNPNGPVVDNSSTAVGYANLGNESVSHTHSGTTNANAAAANWVPRYVNVIACKYTG